MKTWHVLSPVSLALLAVALFLTALGALAVQPRPVYGQEDPPVLSYTVFLPLTIGDKTPSPVPGETIIIDHTCTDIDQIPDEWITEAKKLTFHFAHTSHGSQILSGLEKLAQVDSTYPVSVRNWDPPALPSGKGIRIYDGNNYNGNSYVTPDMYWESTDGQDHTRSVADTGLFNYSMWSWCGQMSYYNSGQIDNYSNTLSQFQSDYPGMRFIYMMGHADGDQWSNLVSNRQRVLNYVNKHDMVLFDFWDIDSYDPDGNYHQSNAEGQCLWCEDWCAAHPEDCTNLPDSCAHSAASQAQKLTCKLKAHAFWWMLARLAGWPGPE